VTYSITGAASGDVTYAAANEGIEQATGVALPWTKDLVVAADANRFLSVSAQYKGGGSITCSISVARAVVGTHTSTGEYAIASCQFAG